MIYVTRFDGSVLYINPHQIEFMEETYGGNSWFGYNYAIWKKSAN